MLFNNDVRRAADALGLHPSTGLTFRAAGVVDGLRAGAFETPGDNDRGITLWAELPHPTDLGWRVRQAGFSLLGGAAVDTGDPAFDGVIEAVVDPAQRELARAALRDDVRAALLRMVRVGRPGVTDRAVTFEVSTFGMSADEFVARLRWCVDAARALDGAAADLAYAPALRAEGLAEVFAEEAWLRGMSLRRNALSASGRLQTAEVSLRARGVATGPTGVDELPPAPAGCALRVRFAEPLEVDLAMRPAGALDRARELVGRGDLRVGDAEFDRAWAIASPTPEAALAALHPAAREHLRRLTDLGLTFTLDRAGITGTGPAPTRPETLPRMLWLADALRDALRPVTRGAAYR